MEMENYQGDLTDVVRATSTAAAALPPDTWEFPPPSAPPPSSSSSTLNPLSFSSALLDDDGQHHNLFGDPFSNFSDPLLHAPPIAGSPHTLYFPPPPPKVDLLPAAAVAGGCGVGGGGGYDFLSDATASTSSTTAPPPAIMAYHHTKMFGENTFAGIQISTPGTSGAGVGCVSKKTEGVGTVCSATEIAAVRSPRIGFNKGVEDQMINNNNSNNNNNNNYKSTSCLAGPVQQISSPRNLGIKRRKSQAKKVVCIPAPATVNSRPSGEVVPSDLWAWRKYGQKPIKGSPYPRGYYRCSSSKGCSARKQVERSRTDPNMLVITYTSEHNHPWPTQRNALAGSTRAHPHSKHHNHNPSSSSAKKKDDKPSTSSSNKACSMSSNDNDNEADVDHHHHDDDTKSQSTTTMMMMTDCVEFSNSYRPTLMDNAVPDQDFFAGLDEIEADNPLQMLLKDGKEEELDGGGLEPLFSSMFDWSSSANSVEDTNKREGL
ncbi:Probable WRKY transcription factor 35 [Linum grandiflorum]